LAIPGVPCSFVSSGRNLADRPGKGKRQRRFAIAARPPAGYQVAMSTDLPDPDRPLRIGTRGSPLALAQAHETRARLMAAHGLPEAAFAIVVIKTTGDRVLDRPLSEIGGKGLFTREIEDALIAGEIDIAVHSMKDMPTLQPDGLAITCLLPREDVRDAFVTLGDVTLASLPAGTVVGTSSLRRRAQLRHRRPDLAVVEFRGNVQTRMRKLSEGVAEATFLAMAGLRRLGMNNIARAPIEPDEMLPAVAQGAIGIEQRRDDDRVSALLAPIHHAETGHRLTAERAFLRGLDGSCQTPIAGLAELHDGTLRLRGEILRPDGSECLASETAGPVSEADAMGTALAAELRGRAGSGFFDA
jgi:hydroxymethylbilane synthase